MSLFKAIKELFHTETPEERAIRIEISNQNNYLDSKVKVWKEMQDFKHIHCHALEFHSQKSIYDITDRELLEMGFYSDSMTRKHFEEIMGYDKNGKKNDRESKHLRENLFCTKCGQPRND